MSRLATAPAPPGPHPFDAVAARYDRTFTHTRLGRWLRGRVWHELAACFRPGERLLELGCGTGEDALFLARRGIRVTATDPSGAMLAAARAKACAEGPAGVVDFRHLDLPLRHRPRLPEPPGGGRFDGAFSDFGALNCLADREPLAAALADRLRPRAPVLLVLMGPLCPWEIATFLLRGRPHEAFRRLRAGRPARVGGRELPVWYPTPRRLRRELAPHFRPVGEVGVGTLLPPSHLAPLVDRHPRLFRPLARLDARAGRTLPGRWLADNYLARFERR